MGKVAGRPESQAGGRLEGKLGVIGLGQMGGSILLASVERGLAREVSVWDSSASALEGVRAAGLGRFLAGSFEEAVSGASLVFVATPVRSIPALVDAARRLVAPGGVVTDTGSTKTWILQTVEKLWREGPRKSGREGGEGVAGSVAPAIPPGAFVGGHPVAGSEGSGFGAARADSFKGHPWLVVAEDAAQAASLGASGLGGVGLGAAAGRVAGFVRALGAEPVFVTAEAHDRFLALTSHLPYLLAAGLADLGSRLSDGDVDSLAPFAAGGFRDATRLALQDPRMGADLLATNVAAVAGALDELRHAAARLLGELPDAASLERAGRFRASLGRVKKWMP